nr:MAG TPA: hypothetical protein [Caudoviricetes sp.]
MSSTKKLQKMAQKFRRENLMLYIRCCYGLTKLAKTYNSNGK